MKAQFLVVILLLSLPACQSSPKMPDPFDSAMNSFVATMFDTEGAAKP
jgi:hypothetical protein